MKTSRLIFYIVTGILVTVACLGLFEQGAYVFVRGVTDKNISFLTLISEVKLILSGVGETDIPFVSGDSKEVNNVLNKIQNYLFVTNLISLVQLMLLAISKSLVLKLLLILLFILSFFPWAKVLSTRILILALALNPGLSIYAVAVHYLAHEASIDFQEKYHQKLMASVVLLKTEKAALMREHSKKLTQISNEGHGTEFFRKLKEDISYDFKELDLDIKGDYSQLRNLIHNAGQDMVRNIFTFCTMVLFCLFLMPIGYALIIYTLYKRLNISTILNTEGTITAELKQATGDIEQTVSNPSFFSRILAPLSVRK